MLTENGLGGHPKAHFPNWQPCLQLKDSQPRMSARTRGSKSPSARNEFNLKESPSVMSTKSPCVSTRRQSQSCSLTTMAKSPNAPALLSFILTLSCLASFASAKMQRFCEPQLGPKLDPCNPLEYIPSNVLTGIAVGSYKAHSISIFHPLI